RIGPSTAWNPCEKIASYVASVFSRTLRTILECLAAFIRRGGCTSRIDDARRLTCPVAKIREQHPQRRRVVECLSGFPEIPLGKHHDARFVPGNGRVARDRALLV